MLMREKEILNIYPSCFLVSGYSRSIILDLPFNRYFFIPNILFDLLSKYNGKTIKQLISEFKNLPLTSILEYMIF